MRNQLKNEYSLNNEKVIFQILIALNSQDEKVFSKDSRSSEELELNLNDAKEYLKLNQLL